MPSLLIANLTELYKRGSGEWERIKYIFALNEEFAQVSVSKQNLDYNPKVMRKLLYFLLNYTSRYVNLRYKAIKYTVFVVCRVKWKKYSKIFCHFAHILSPGNGDVSECFRPDLLHL